MRTSFSTLMVAFGLAVDHAAATGWTDFKSFTSPANTDNRCNNDQKSGFDWNELPIGDFDSYGQFGFSGFKCADSFRDKRDVLTPRNFQSKCIKGAVKKDAPSGPKISGGSGKPFSIKDLQVSSSEDTELDLIYSYENGDVCKQTVPCSKGGSTIENSQCGGAIAVSFKLSKEVEQSECEVGIHRVGFDCGPPSAGPPNPPSTSGPESTQSTSASSPSVPTTVPSLSITYSIPKGNFSTPAELGTSTGPFTTRGTLPGTVPASSADTPPVVTPPTTGGGSPPASSPSSPTEAESRSETSTPGVSAPFTAVPVVTSSPTSPTVPETPSPPGSTQAVVTTVKVHTTLTTCPVTNTVTSGTREIIQSSFTVSTVVETVVSTICTKCIAPKPSTPGASGESPTAPVIGSSATFAISSLPGVPLVETLPVESTPVTSAFSSRSESSVSPPSPSAPATTQDVVTTVMVQTTVTTCPVTNTVTSGTTRIVVTSKTVSTILNTITSTVCTKCVDLPATPSSNTQDGSTVETSPATVPEPPSSSTSSVPAPPVPAPPVLPKCLNTWIELTTCANNADSDCYCKDSVFTKNVQECISCWAENPDEVQAALSYLAGICAPHVPENPGIITDVPKKVNLAPVPVPVLPPANPSATGALGTVPVSPPSPAPVTTIAIVKTVTVPCTFSAGISAGQPIPSSSTVSVLSTEVTVPQVQFTTQSPSQGATGSPRIVLAAGSPAPAPAVPTPTSPPRGPDGGPTSVTSFATGILPTGQRLPAQTSLSIFTGDAGRVDASTVGKMMIGLIAVWAMGV